MKATELLGRYKPAERTVRILLDGSLLSELESARQEVRRTQRQEMSNPQGLATKVPELENKVAELEEQADDQTVELVVRAIPGTKFDELKRLHQPTEEQWERYREQAKGSPMFAVAPEFDPDGLAPDLIGLSVVSVDGEPVDWDATDGRTLWDGLHDGARADLLEAAWSVNRQGSSRPFSGTGTDTTPSSGPGSTTQQNGESPSPSSVEGS